MGQSEARRLLRRSLRRNVSGAPANWFVIPVYAAVCIMWRPPGLVLEQPDRANAAISAQIEPVQRPARNANQVPGFDLDRNNLALLRVDMEQASSRDDVANLVLVVRMLDVKFCEHCIQPRSVGVDVDPMRGGVTAPR